MIKEFCCGFSLRTGNLILIWSVLTLESFHSVLYLTALFALRHFDSTPQQPFFPDVIAYYLIWSITGIIISILGLKAVHEKNPKLLNGIFWYFCYGVIFNVFRVVMMTILTRVTGHSPKREKLEALIHFRLSTNDLAAIFAFVYTLTAAIFTYFALIVKSYRDKMMMKIEATKSSMKRIDSSVPTELNQQTGEKLGQEKEPTSNDDSVEQDA